jgi:hypothetical protein
MQHFWATHECNVVSILTGAAQQFKPWIKSVGDFTFTRSLRADAGEFTIQNLSGNLIDREVAALIKAGEFTGAYCIYRRHYLPADQDAFEFHGFLSELMDVNVEEVTFRLLQLFQPNELSAFDGRYTRPCRWRFQSAQCGYRRGELFVPLTTADIFSASTIGNSSLTLVPDLYKDEVVTILAGTGNGQERYISTHTATTFTLKSNWTTTPDATSQFIATGPGTMKVSPQLADIYSSTTIGKTGLGRTVDEDKDELVAILSGTGAGQRRRITTNSATTYTVSPAWTTTPDATSRFIVIYRLCAKDRASCVTRGVVERFSGIIHLQPQISQVTTPQAATGAGGGGRGREPPRRSVS